jgi:transcriptional regulator with XRE-family HTH domain
MTQQELVKAIAGENKGRGISQSYLSQIESGARPHLTNTTRQILAKFFKVHPGYLVEDPLDYQPELRTLDVMEDQLDLWLINGAERFCKRDPELCRALLTLAEREDTRRCVLLLESIVRAPGLLDRLAEVLAPEAAKPVASTNGSKPTQIRSTRKGAAQ